MHGHFTPIIPRDLRLEVPERLNARGQVVTALDEDALRRAILQLRDQGCEALVIHFLHAYANPVHELRAGEIARGIWSNDYITLGHKLLSESREYERGVTAAVNASFSRCSNVMWRAGQGTGRAGLWSRPAGDERQRRDGRRAGRGERGGQDGDVWPCVGRDGGSGHGPRAGMSNLLTYDMGGTSTDVAMIRNGLAPSRTRSRSNMPCRSTFRWSMFAPWGPVVGPSPGSTRGACCGSGRERGLLAGARLLWARGHARHDFRREPDPGPPIPSAALARRLRQQSRRMKTQIADPPRPVRRTVRPRR